jgi:hypothetical protein
MLPPHSLQRSHVNLDTFLVSQLEKPSCHERAEVLVKEQLLAHNFQQLGSSSNGTDSERFSLSLLLDSSSEILLFLLKPSSLLQISTRNPTLGC